LGARNPHVGTKPETDSQVALKSMNRRSLNILAGISLFGLLAGMAVYRHSARRTVELKLVQAEHIDIIDTTGQRMWLVTATLTNSTFAPIQFEPQSHLLEVQVGGQWQMLTNGWLVNRLGPAGERSSADTEVLLLPAAAHRCRLQLKANYQHEALSFQFLRQLGRHGLKPGESEMTRALRGQELLHKFSPRLCEWIGQTNNYPQQYVSSSRWTLLDRQISLDVSKPALWP
jgi:hypothetical protein